MPLARQLSPAPQPRAQLAPPTRAPPVSYEHLQPPKRFGKGKKATRMQRDRILDENESRNGAIRDDQDGTPLVRPQQHRRGVRPPDNEAQVDHVVPRNKGGTNEYGNLRVRSRKANIKKSDRDPTPEDF